MYMYMYKTDIYIYIHYHHHTDNNDNSNHSNQSIINNAKFLWAFLCGRGTFWGRSRRQTRKAPDPNPKNSKVSNYTGVSSLVESRYP